MFEILKFLLSVLYILIGGVGLYVLLLAFFGSMEIVYKAKILGSSPTPWWERVLNRLAWGINGMGTVHRILRKREQLFRTVLLMETMETEERAPGDSSAVEILSYRPTTTGYAPMVGTILVFHGNSEEEGEPLYVLRPFEFLAEDWRAAIGRGV